MRSEILLLGTLVGALVIIFSRPGPQLWTVAFLVVLLLYGLSFANTYGYPHVEAHGHRHNQPPGKNHEHPEEYDHQPHGGGWKHY